MQADVIIDETYAENPTTYDSAALLKEWGLTEAEAATLPAWANKKVCTRLPRSGRLLTLVPLSILWSHAQLACAAHACVVAVPHGRNLYAPVFFPLCHRYST